MTFFLILMSLIGFLLDHPLQAKENCKTCPSLEKTNRSEPVVVVDAEARQSRMPGSFRTTSDTFKTKRMKKWVKEGKKLPSRKGMDQISGSASAQFSDLSFRNLVKVLEKDRKLYVFDLRQESHGFANGHALSLYGYHNAANKGLTQAEAQENEALFLKNLASKSPACVYKVLEKKKGEIFQAIPLRVHPAPVQSEKELVESYGASYFRIRVLDHWFPSIEEMSSFIEIVRSLPEKAHAHFHCRGGKGRASQFLVYFDILKNARHVELGDILDRHYLIGGKHLGLLSRSSEKAWKQEGAKARQQHVAYVYEYAKDPEGYPKRSWKDWLSYKKYTDKYPFSLL